MRILYSLIAVFFFFNTATADNWTKIDQNKDENPEIKIVQTSTNFDIVKFNLNAYKLSKVITNRGKAMVINSPEASKFAKKGEPNLPKLSESIIIPDKAGLETEVVYNDYVVFDDIDIAPSKGTIYRNQDPDKIPYTYGDVYSENKFFPSNEADLTKPFILREHRGVTVNVYPFRYNPVTKKLRVYTDISVKVKYTDKKSVNTLERNRNLSASEDYEDIYNNHFLNYSQEKYTPLDEGTPGKMLIISYGSFMDEMEPYISWKREKGIETEIVDVSTIGNASAIKTYIANEYNTNGLNYVLLVGDEAQVPTTETTNDSDNEYVYISGNDSYAECFIGRISAETGAGVTNQINKIIEYERDYTTSETWLENALGSASDEGGNGQGDDGESDIVHMQNIGIDLTTYGYSVSEENQTGGSNAGISSAVNTGIGVANYVGHGSVTTWVNTSYSNTDVNALTNNGKYPFIFSVACVNGDFKNNTCFAEAWLRATNGGNPAGAIGMLASTINQSWDEPMDGQDEMNDLLVDSYANNKKRTYGGISFNGMFHMIEEYASADGPRMADTWTLFGDPSLMVRTKTPADITVSHANALNVGASSFSVNCNEDGALVSLTKEVSGETEIIGTGYVSGGTANVTITPFSAPGTMKVTVTAFDKVTYQADVNVIVPSGPYMLVDNITIDDSQANNNSQLNNNESVLLDVSLENIGVAVANGVVANISTSNSYINITDNNENFGTINDGAIASQNGAYALSVADGIADQTAIPVDFAITDNNSNSWNVSENLIVHAPVPEISFTDIDDSGGTNDGLLDPGETVILNFDLSNAGHNTAEAGSLSVNNITNASAASGSVNVSQISAGANQNAGLTITVDAGLSPGSQVSANLTYSTGAYSADISLTLPVGEQIETWESNDFSSYDWENDQTYPWTIVTDNPYAGTYCLKSGDITDDQTTTFTINIDVTSADDLSFYKKVSCEEGETGWWGNYNWYDYLSFSIDGTEQDKWDGIEAWTQHTYSVQAGDHDFTWEYSKDGAVTDNDDCAWLDDIKLPPHSQATFIQQTHKDVNDFSFDIVANPVDNRAEFVFELPENNNVDISIIDLNGRIISNVYHKQSPEGTYRVTENVSSLPSGMYFVRFATDNSRATKQLIISR